QTPPESPFFVNMEVVGQAASLPAEAGSMGPLTRQANARRLLPRADKIRSVRTIPGEASDRYRLKPELQRRNRDLTLRDRTAQLTPAADNASGHREMGSDGFAYDC